MFQNVRRLDFLEFAFVHDRIHSCVEISFRVAEYALHQSPPYADRTKFVVRPVHSDIRFLVAVLLSAECDGDGVNRGVSHVAGFWDLLAIVEETNVPKG